MSSVARASFIRSAGVVRKEDAATASRTYAVPVLERLRAEIRLFDVLIALGFVVAALTEATLRYHREPAMLAANLTGALTFGCLALRRSRPLLTVSVITVVFSVGSVAQAVLSPHQSGDEVVPVFGLLLVSYSLGAYASHRQLLWGAWQPALLVLIVDLTEPSANSIVSAALFITIFVSAAPILAGRLVRRRSELVRQLREQAVQIDAQRRVQVEAAVADERLRMAQRFHRTLVIDMQSLAAKAATLETSGGAPEIGDIEREARELLSEIRQEVVALTGPIPNNDEPVHVPAPRGFADDVAQPWTVLAGGALVAGLLVETQKLPLHVPFPVAWLACIVLALPLALAWRRPLLAIGTLWVLAALFDGYVAELDGSFTAIGFSFVPPFLVAALAPRRQAIVGLAVCGLGELACFGPGGLATNAAIVVGCWIAGAVFNDRAQLVEQLRANNALLEEQRAAAARRGVAEERLRVAQELHDAVGHGLTVIVLQAGAARRIAASDPARTETVLHTITTVAREGLAELERGTASASDDAADDRSVESLLTAVRAAGLRVEANVEDVGGRLTPHAQLVVYRVVQESLTNILKHAPNASAELSIQARAEYVEVVVTNGAPSTVATAPTGLQHGLRGMRARVEACGGRFSWNRRADGGFELRAELPAALVAST